VEARLGIHDIRHYAHSRALRYLGHVFRIQVTSPSCRPTALYCHQRGCIIHITRSTAAAAGASVTSETCKPESELSPSPGETRSPPNVRFKSRMRTVSARS
jgi:hypothetical protein